MATQNLSALVTKYKDAAAGVYREIVDATSEAATASEQNVVVVGQFAKGPVMRPIYCKDAPTAHAVFGIRDAKLEAKGCFGMLMAEHALEQGPIWIMNVKNIDQYKETVQAKQLAVNNFEVDQLLDEKVSTVYDTTKFWKVDTMYGVHGDGPTLTFVATQQDDVTLVITKYNSSDYNYTIAKVKEYNSSFGGEGLNDDDFVNDYLIQVHVFKTNLKSAKLSVDNAFVNGMLNLSMLSKIQADDAAKYFATYTGAVGNVIDINGNNLNIATVMNADSNASGVLTAINADAIARHNVDIIGKGALKFDEQGSKLPETQQISRLGYKSQPTVDNICIYVDEANRRHGYIYFDGNTAAKVPAVGSVIANETGTVRVLESKYVANTYALPSDAVFGTKQYPVMPDGMPFPLSSTGVKVYPSTSPLAGQEVKFKDDNTAYWYVEDFKETQATWIIKQPTTNINRADTVQLTYNFAGTTYSEKLAAAETLDALVLALKEFLNTKFGQQLQFDVTTESGNIVTIKTNSVAKGITAFSIIELVLDGAAYEPEDKNAVASNVVTITEYEITVADKKVTCNGETKDINVESVAALYGKQTPIYLLTFSSELSSKLLGNEASLFDALLDVPIEMQAYGKACLTRINGKPITVIPNSYILLNPWYDVELGAPIQTLSGIVDKEVHYVNGTAARQKLILDRLNETGIMSSFSDPTIFRCRYMIDTFKTYIEPNAKNQYAQLAAEAKRFLVIIPAPFYYELRTSKNPDFHDIVGQFDMAYVALGSNPDKPSTNSFSYPQNSDTAKFLYPVMNVIYNDGFNDKVVPATGAVGKLFYSKLNGVKRVYDIVAGADFPVSAAGIVGPEFDSNAYDRKAMQKMGTNVLQTINGVLQIRSSKTAFQSVLSAFNYPETLEKCFFVSDYVEPILEGRLFKYNSADARLAVKNRADNACDIMVADGVISAYENICDLSNNTAEVRKAGIILLDTVLYNEYGITIAVHRTTVKDPQE